MARPLPRGARLLAAGFAVSGTVHLVRPSVFAPLVPAWVPAHREVILASGVAELACAAGLAVPATRNAAALASAALLLGVWPGNLQMALDSRRSPSRAVQAVAWGRMPLQVPMIRAALSARSR